MKITSTQFQQNVGKYLKLADEGEAIKIKKLKPVRNYILKIEVTNSRAQKVKELIKKGKKTPYPKGIHNSLDYQNWLRS